MGRICLREWQLPRFVLRSGRVLGLVKKPGELSRTHLDILHAKTCFGLGRDRLRRGWPVRPPVASSDPAPGRDAAGNGRRYCEKNCPLRGQRL